MIPIILTISGSDSSGGAGIQADIKAIHANGGYAASVVTAITAQNTVEVSDNIDLPVSIIESQLDAVLSDMSLDAVKIGMLASGEIVESVAWKLEEHEVRPIVVDPVMTSKSGYELLDPDSVSTLVRELLPLACILTPNADEAGFLVGGRVETLSDAREAARIIHGMGPKYVLVKGGHIDEEGDAVDILFDGNSFFEYRKERIESINTHGTGCTFASAIATNLAKGMKVPEAVRAGKIYVTEAIRHGLSIGAGNGPTDHFYRDRTDVT
ncbi:MAG: bifunctional hydroxymethylpyrimidine kinase/phosphomethylpyrimidine kinase [Rhodothermia bacterium]